MIMNHSFSPVSTLIKDNNFSDDCQLSGKEIYSSWDGGEKNKRRKGGCEDQGAGFIYEIIPVSTV